MMTTEQGAAKNEMNGIQASYYDWLKNEYIYNFIHNFAVRAKKDGYSYREIAEAANKKGINEITGFDIRQRWISGVMIASGNRQKKWHKRSAEKKSKAQSSALKIVEKKQEQAKIAVGSDRSKIDAIYESIDQAYAKNFMPRWTWKIIETTKETKAILVNSRQHIVVLISDLTEKISELTTKITKLENRDTCLISDLAEKISELTTKITELENRAKEKSGWFSRKK